MIYYLGKKISSDILSGKKFSAYKVILSGSITSSKIFTMAHRSCLPVMLLNCGLFNKVSVID